jgi:hypothetical protein
MPFNVNQFRAQWPFDAARPNLFECIVNFPQAAGPAAEAFAFKCRASSIPGSTIGTVIAPYFGRELKLAGNRTFEDWTVTVMNDENFDTRYAFEEWLSGINAHVTNYRDPGYTNPIDYQQDMIVTHYGKEGNTLAVYQLIGAFPTVVEPIQLDWGANDQIEEFSVTFSYQWWTNFEVARTEG